MSPPCGVGVFEASVAVVERDPAIESLIQLDFGPGKTEAAVLGRDLEAAALPLHDVVVADYAFMQERADAVELVRSGTPSFGGVARSTRETAVVVRDEAPQHDVGGVEVGRLGETEFAAQAVLRGEPRPSWRRRRRRVSRLSQSPSTSLSFSTRWWSLKPAYLVRARRSTA
jgi:hypothetical protein